MSTPSDGSIKQNWMSLSVEHACVHILACVFSVPELTNSRGTVPPIGEVINIDDRLDEEIDDGIDGRRGTGDGDDNSCVHLVRNGVVSLSVRKP